MKQQKHWLRRLGWSVAAVATTLLTLPAHALNWQWGEVDIGFDSDISLGASWRLEDPADKLVTPGNAGGRASSSVTDDGTLNWRRSGDNYSLILKGVHDLEILYRNVGAFTRFKYWYDYALEEQDLDHGNVNRYSNSDSLDDSGFSRYAKNKDAVLLDAFVFGNFDLGEMPLNVRVGKQVLSWGESTFIQNGINIINPVDVSAFRRPGVEIKEGLLPVWMGYFSLGLTENLTMEAFYQWDWDKTEIEGCGTFFSTIDLAADGCRLLTVTNALPDGASVASGLFITRESDDDPDDGGQYGVSFRYFAENLNSTEFGAYYVRYHSRTPYLTGRTDANVENGCPDVPFIPGNPCGGNPTYRAQFPEDLDMYGISVATNFGGWAVSGEISYKPDYPLQINSTELLQSALGQAPWAQLTPIVVAAPGGSVLAGYREFDFTQVQMTVIKFYEQIMGASRLALVGEVGYSHLDDLPDKQDLRFQRSPTWGMGSFTPIPVAPGEFITCAEGSDFLGIAPPNTTPSNCQPDGYATEHSWGYRVRGILTYSDVFAGINLQPQVAWLHDVSGYGPGAGFHEDTKSLALSLRADYLDTYNATLTWAQFFNADYATRTDRDFLSFSVGVKF